MTMKLAAPAPTVPFVQNKIPQDPPPISVQHHLEIIALTKVLPNPLNARTHSKKQINQIAESIQKFGFNNPILANDPIWTHRR